MTRQVGCSSCNNPYHPATGHRLGRDTFICGVCTRAFIEWLKRREGSMGHRKKGQLVSFTDAALSWLRMQKQPTPADAEAQTGTEEER